MNRLKMAVVGVGALGRHHARILSELDEVELVAVAETNPETGTRVAEQCGTQWVPDFLALLNRVDAVSIAVPTTAHRLVAAEFLKRKVPVLVEKPLAGNVEEAEQLVEMADRFGVILQVGHVERFNPATVVASQLCGPPKYVRAERLSPYSFRSTDIGVVHDLMIHDLDLVLAMVGSPIRRIEAFGVCLMGGHEDSVQARLVFEDGCVADLTASRIHPSGKRELQIWSAHGCVTANLTSREVVSYAPSETLRCDMPPVDRARQPQADIEQLKSDVFGRFLTVTKAAVPDTDALTAQLSAFVECINTGRQPLVDGHQALRSLRAADQILDSIASHQWDGVAHGPVGPYLLRPSRRQQAA